MIPENSISDVKIVEASKPSQTYKVDTLKNEVNGYIDGLAAVKQSVELTLTTERYKYPIYSWNYGVEFESLVGKDFSFVWPEVKRRIKEALMQDTRITDISNFNYTRWEDELLLEFSVSSSFGSFSMNTVVNI